MNKVCTNCNHNKPLAEYRKHQLSKDGLCYYCRDCERDINKKKYQNKTLEEKKLHRLKVKEWKMNNRRKANSYKNRNPVNRIKSNLRKRLRRYLNCRSLTGPIPGIGCSSLELRRHIENQFQPGMTWENYGHKTWHIDHIKPISKFDLTNKEELLKINHYTNLQPLWAGENYKKTNIFCENDYLIQLNFMPFL